MVQTTAGLYRNAFAAARPVYMWRSLQQQPWPHHGRGHHRHREKRCEMRNFGLVLAWAFCGLLLVFSLPAVIEAKNEPIGLLIVGLCFVGMARILKRIGGE